MATFTVDLPAFGCLAPFSGDRDDALSTPDTATEIVTDTVFQPIAVGTYGGGAYDPSVNVALTAIPDGAAVSNVRYVMIAYRESGSDITPDPTAGFTPPPPENQPFLGLDSSARSANFAIDDLPIGGYAGEIVSKAAENYVQLQLDRPLNRALLYYETSASPPPIHVAYLAIRITYTNISVAPPCQLYPRDDDQGVGSAAIWPPPSSGRPGSYY